MAETQRFKAWVPNKKYPNVFIIGKKANQRKVGFLHVGTTTPYINFSDDGFGMTPNDLDDLKILMSEAEKEYEQEKISHQH